jgi:hypothetical protein
MNGRKSLQIGISKRCIKLSRLALMKSTSGNFANGVLRANGQS